MLSKEEVGNRLSEISRINPFVNRTTHWTWIELLKTVFGTVTLLAPLRLLSIIVTLVFVIPIMYVAQLGFNGGRAPNSKKVDAQKRNKNENENEKDSSDDLNPLKSSVNGGDLSTESLRQRRGGSDSSLPSSSSSSSPSSIKSVSSDDDDDVERCQRVRPMGGWRRSLSLWLAPMSRFILFAAGFWQVDVSGEPDEEAALTVMNHSTPLDIYVAVCYARVPSMVSRAVEAKNPAFGQVLRATQSVLVERTNVSSSDAAKQAIVKRSRLFVEHNRRARDGEPRFPTLLMFPEATTTNQRALIQFKLGAFLPGAPVQPVALRYASAFDASWVCGTSLFTLLYRACCQFNNRLSVQYLPLHVPTEEERRDPALFASNVRAEIARALGGDIAQTMHSYDDVRVQLDALEHGFCSDEFVVEAKRLYSLFPGIGLDTLRRAVKAFALCTPPSECRVSLDSLHARLGDTDRVRQFFESMRYLNNERITFLEFAVAIGLAEAEQSSPLGAMLDVDSNGIIDRNDLNQFLALPEAIGQRRRADDDDREPVAVVDFVSLLNDNDIRVDQVDTFFESTVGILFKAFLIAQRPHASSSSASN
jgi:lysophosphatidylcholine acyltransferase / lyso-PAF acetyltransferase